MVESDLQTVAAEDVCLKRFRCENGNRPNEVPKTVKEEAPVVPTSAGIQFKIIGMA